VKEEGARRDEKPKSGQQSARKSSYGAVAVIHPTTLSDTAGMLGGDGVALPRSGRTGGSRSDEDDDGVSAAVAVAGVRAA
jgi:hypothetical protein